MQSNCDRSKFLGHDDGRGWVRHAPDDKHRARRRLSAISGILIAAIFGVSLAYAPAAQAQIQWAKVPAKEIVLFYPATFSWERLFTKGSHSGQTKYLEGKNCAACHAGIDEGPMGMHLVQAGGYIEPKPIKSKPPSVKAKVRAAHDATNIYVRVEFAPGEQPNAMMDKAFETKIAMMFDDGSVRDATRAGCWSTCHSNLSSMTGAKEGVTKYLVDTHTSPVPNRASDVLRPAEDLAKMRAAGQYMEYWQARLSPGAPVQTVDGTVFETRTENPTPAVTATATQDKGVWTVTFTRKLVAGAPYKDFKPGKTYTVGFSLHAGYTTQRFHYVGFERTLVLGSGTADFIAVTQK